MYCNFKTLCHKEGNSEEKNWILPPGLFYVKVSHQNNCLCLQKERNNKFINIYYNSIMVIITALPKDCFSSWVLILEFKINKKKTKQAVCQKGKKCDICWIGVCKYYNRSCSVICNQLIPRLHKKIFYHFQ